MGRKLRRKQAKKEGKSLQKDTIEENYQIKKLIKITVLLVFIGGIVYLTSALFITKELDWFDKKEKASTSSVENSILASSIFKQSEEEYYVYFYDFDDEDDSITSTVTSKLTNSKVYRVNTSSALNGNYVSEATNKQAKTLEELKVKAPTVIKITGDQITAYYEDTEINNLK